MNSELAKAVRWATYGQHAAPPELRPPQLIKQHDELKRAVARDPVLAARLLAGYREFRARRTSWASQTEYRP